MKFLIIFTLVLSISACIIEAQFQCYAKPAFTNCRMRPNAGHGGQNCRTLQMWYFRNGQCHSMQYLGCGGNGNRYCSRVHCERRCRRRG